MTESRPAAVLWDMDGTLVDTEPYWMASETALVASFGGSWTTEDAVQLVGQGLWHSARVLQSHGVDLAEQEIIDRLTNDVIDRTALEIPWRPGSRELLRELHELAVPNVLVTMSIRRMAEAITTNIGFDPFVTLITGDEVTHSKPHPEPYHLGAAAAGVQPADCVALEDSAPGVASAVAAGAVVIAMPMHVPLLEHDDYVIWERGAEGRSAVDLFSVFRERTTA